ncbi:glycogen/starch/alpha-glucan phosphorylase [uncultured Shewanella sp.]|uniref:glycogen/starch/alpha-glucan phosphorylase n=1 Tax=uncultured Shewanella sp. TaxID=173975 RepID=UPI0026238D58|nr:glycogen/starch/alpha-glucan phosphorylase [uncultured Shewanella sp.]
MTVHHNDLNNESMNSMTSPARSKQEDKSVNEQSLGGEFVDYPHCNSCDPLTATFQRVVINGLSRDENNPYDLFHALALSVKEQMMHDWRRTRFEDIQAQRKQVAYLSLEFLMGRALGNTLLNLGLTEEAEQVVQQYRVDLAQLETLEHDAGLGNGGLGRLAACFLDSCACMDLPVTGYGIRYEYGMFTQKIVNGYQVEQADRWLKGGHPWDVIAPNHNVLVPFYGRCEVHVDHEGRQHHTWVDTQDVIAVAYDVPVPGYRNNRVNTLRLWKAQATEGFDLEEFNQGDYTEAVAYKNLAEQITMVLYPNDSSENGKELRLRQQYFLSSASLQDILNTWVKNHGRDFTDFSRLNVMQLNDTHPAIAVPELMRLLMDHYALGWNEAWKITSGCMAYTNHTLLPEALECWPVRMFELILPRILEIVYEINARYLNLVAHHWPGDSDKLTQMSIIDNTGEPTIRMAYLAIVASFSVNGVAGLHTQLLKSGLFQQFYALWPDKFNNKTNGVTPRRWLAFSNPRLARLLDQKLGEQWIEDLTLLQGLKDFLNEDAFLQEWREIKKQNKVDLVTLIKKECSVDFDPEMLFDVQVKRIHEYKRQLLNILHVIHLYQKVLKGNVDNMVPRCVLIAGKAAPGYAMAKLIVKLANNVAEMVNSEPLMQPYLRFAFLPNYNVTAMEKICPATDLSEQISTAGKEASGTGNMKFMMNGALTIGTLDGANIEILEAVGDDAFFLFGMNAEEVDHLRPHYQPQQFIESSSELFDVLTLLKSGHFNLLEPGIFDPIIYAIESSDEPWMTAADFESFRCAQQAVAQTYLDKKRWAQLSIRNTASSGGFSSDATIAAYRDDIWHV